jgi:hypothetical protein
VASRMLSSFKAQVVLEAVRALDTDGSPVPRSRLGQWCISPADPYAGRLADVSAASHSTRSMRMGGTPQGTIQVRRRGLVVARCGIGVADSFGMKQCRGGCPISDIAVLVDRQGLHEGDS